MPTPAVRTILLAALTASSFAAADNIPTQHNEATVAQLEADMAAGKLTSEQLTREYLARIDALDQRRGRRAQGDPEPHIRRT